MTEKPRYLINYDEIPEIHVKPKDPGNNAPFVVRMVHGSDTSIMFADRGPGYHTKPHYHDAEQMNHVVSGEIWFFVDGHGYRASKGDVMRIPRNKIHWAWNRGDEHCVLFESHTPPLIGDDNLRDKVVALLGPDDDRAAIQGIKNLREPYDQAEVDAIEARAIAEGDQRSTE